MDSQVIDTDGGMRVLVRPAREGDQGYVLSTWALYLCEVGDLCRWRKADHYAGARPVGGRSRAMVPCAQSRDRVDRFVDHPAVKVVVAADPSSSDDLLGWLAYTDTGAARVIHGAYVRLRYRDRKVARAMLVGAGLHDARPLLYTLPGPAAKTLLSKPQYHNAALMRAEEFLSP